jgi:NADH dehydrogenase FAD-containing subunit
MIAPVAIQQGAHAARNIIRQISGLSPNVFHYRDRGKMVTIGRNAGVAQLLGWSFTGFPAWLVWLVVHLYNLIGLSKSHFRDDLLGLGLFLLRTCRQTCHSKGTPAILN